MQSKCTETDDDEYHKSEYLEMADSEETAAGVAAGGDKPAAAAAPAKEVIGELTWQPPPTP